MSELPLSALKIILRFTDNPNSAQTQLRRVPSLIDLRPHYPPLFHLWRPNLRKSFVYVITIIH